MTPPILTMRWASLLRWAIVAMHTAMLLSLFLCPLRATTFLGDRIWIRGVDSSVMYGDLPVTVLSLSMYASGTADSSGGTAAIIAVYVLLGGLQWYMIASLLAWMTCGFQKAVPIASKQFGIAIALGMVLVIGSAMAPWDWCPRPRNNRPYTLPAVAFSGDSKDLGQSVVVPTLDTPIPQHKNVICAARFSLPGITSARTLCANPPRFRGPKQSCHASIRRSSGKTICRPTRTWRRQDSPRMGLWKRSKRR